MSTPGPAHASASDAASVLRQKKTSQETRHDILVVAGRQFARAGYGAVRLKDIADEVGITAPLVVRYFGSKEALFREVAMDEGGSTIDWADLKGGLDSLGHRLASWLLTYWLDRSNNFPALALVRSSDFEDSKALFAAEFERRLVKPLAEVMPEPDPLLRARMVAAQLLGVGFFGLGLLFDPDTDAPGHAEVDRFVTLLAASLQAIISA